MCCDILVCLLERGANAMPRDIAKGMKAGFFDYLTKPIRVMEFMNTLNAALEFAEKRFTRTDHSEPKP